MRIAAVLLLVSLVAAGCLQSAPGTEITPNVAIVTGVDAEGFAPALFDKVLFQEMDLGVIDGMRLHADVYLPDGAKAADAPTTFPTILLLSPYWGGGTAGEPVGYLPYDFLVQRLLPRGYAVVFGDLVGNGGSSGCWDFMGPVERAGSVAMVEAIAEQPWSDGKVGMMGLSYDGMTQIMAASDAAPHLVTIVPAAALTESYRGLIQSGVHYGAGWHATPVVYEQASLAPPGTNPERYPGWAERATAAPACLADNHMGDLPTNEYSDYHAARDFRPLASQVKASVFATQGFFDPAVKPDNFGAWFEGVPTLKKAWLGFWFHQYPTAQNAGRDDMYLTLHKWFDHELKGIDNGIDVGPAIDVQDSLGRWRYEASWPPADAAPATLALGADGALVSAGAKEDAVSFGGPLSVADLVTGGSTATLAFKGEALAAPLHIAGTPVLNVTLASSGAAGTIVARLYDDDRMVSQGAFNLLFAGGLASPVPLTPGAPVQVGLTMYPTDWVVLPGHVLSLVLSTSDVEFWYDPDASASTLTLTAGPDALLTLPTIVRGDDVNFLTSCGKSLKDDVAGCFQDLKDQGVQAD